MEISFETTGEILSIVNAIGRTEDLAFSPDNLKLAIASYELNKVLVFNIEVDISSIQPKAQLSNLCEINSSSFNLPHGIAWINNETIIVANRASNAVVIKIPNFSCTSSIVELAALQTLPHIKESSPHSTDCIDAISLGDGLYEVFICSNDGNYVSHYILNENDNFSVKASAFLLKKNIKIPDGIKLSQDSNWLAVSNHDTHQAFVYKNSQTLGCEALPNAILHGTNYPHGITFSNDQQIIFLADAGSPYVYVYVCNNSQWSGDYYPAAKIRIMDDETFKLGHTNKQEGGAKGVSLNSDSNLMAITCGTRPVAFFYVKELIESLQKNSIEVPNRQTQNTGNMITKSLLRITENMKITFNELATAHQHQIYLLKSSHSWKVTSPLRKIKTLASQYAFSFKSKIKIF